MSNKNSKRKALSDEQLENVTGGGYSDLNEDGKKRFNEIIRGDFKGEDPYSDLPKDQQTELFTALFFYEDSSFFDKYEKFYNL